MLHLQESVRMVVAVNMHLRAGCFSACRMSMCYRSRFVRKNVDCRGYIISTQQVALYPLCFTTSYVIVVGCVNLIIPLSHYPSAPPAIARNVLCKPVYKGITIVVVLHMYHCIGRQILSGTLTLLSKPAQSVIPVIRPLREALSTLVTVLGESR